MGISYQTACFLINCAAKDSPLPGKVDFSRTITLGRQNFGLTKKECDKLFNKYFSNDFIRREKTLFLQELENATALRFPRNRYSEPFFKMLGKPEGKKVTADSLDYSEYEEASVIHDITVPVPEELKQKYTCVFDGGLLEHIYDYPTALKNAMEMVSVGGHLILATPGNNWFGHGFYQFSPELFYSILREENGFTDTQVYLCNADKWYLVQNPRVIHRRTEISPKWPDATLFVVSTKNSEAPSNIVAYQSDYEDIWESEEPGTSAGYITALKDIYRRLPLFMVKIIRNSYRAYNNKIDFKKVFTRVDL